MKTLNLVFLIIIFISPKAEIRAQTSKAVNPVIWTDVPDMSMIRMGDTYYMCSITMHISPGVPIMKSIDLINWEIESYAYDILDDVNTLNLTNCKNAYGRGS
ncbi:MAG: family 43 glycosylhydrolase [Bacteroidales bacterium]